jgi:hypothetical protein
MQASGIFDISACFRRFCSLSRDPFANVSRAVPQRDSTALGLSKKFHRVPVDQNDVLKVDGNCTRFPLDQVAKCIHFLFCDPAAYAKRNNVVAVDNSVDSPGHFEAVDEALAIPLILCLSDAALLRPRIDVLQMRGH